MKINLLELKSLKKELIRSLQSKDNPPFLLCSHPSKSILTELKNI
jgi:hypothetical protein